MSPLRIALCQIDPTVGDLAGNEALILESSARAASAGAQLAVFPELALTGYPPEDLLLHEHFVTATEAAADRICAATPIPTVFGSVAAGPDGLRNVAIFSDPGTEAKRSYSKQRLPNYGVFDEQRYFAAGREPVVIELDGRKLGLSICEDIWHSGEPTDGTVAAGAETIVNISASPFHAGKFEERLAAVSARAEQHSIPVLYCSLVGAQDELVFDGRSFAVAADGSLVARAAAFEPDLLIVDLEDDSGRIEASPSGPEEVELALQAGLTGYVDKNGFKGVVFGISGGIDSAVVATAAVDALGPERVHAVVMPSPWSSPETQADARLLAENLGIDLFEFPIEPAMKAAESILGTAGRGPGAALAAENIQARIRGNLLMALSNTHGWLVVTTGNKSELAVGFSTLYGDAAGGFGLLKDVPKTLVYELARLRNARGDAPIPQTIIERAPSAELRPGQRDEDSLPPYERLDDILRRCVELREDGAAIVSAGHDPEEVNRVLRLVDRAEFKRRQYPPGVKITPLAFGRDRRMPMTNRWADRADA